MKCLIPVAKTHLCTSHTTLSYGGIKYNNPRLISIPVSNMIETSRKPKFFLFNYIQPSVLINLLALFVFLIPAESGRHYYKCYHHYAQSSSFCSLLCSPNFLLFLCFSYLLSQVIIITISPFLSESLSFCKIIIILVIVVLFGARQISCSL